MAVAWSADKLGHATKDVIVRDPVALTVSAPRFLTLGDEARLDLSVHNVEGPAAPIGRPSTQARRRQKQASLDRAVDLKAGERKAERIAIKPADVGRLTYDVRVTGPDGIDVKRRLALRREAAGRRHQAHDGRRARGQGRQDHAVARICSPI